MKAIDALFTDAVLLTSSVTSMEKLVKEGLFESFPNGGLRARLEDLLLRGHLIGSQQELVDRSVWRRLFSHRELVRRIEDRVEWLKERSRRMS
jgi:hypothetical protein